MTQGPAREAAVGMGSNLGDRFDFMVRAREALCRLPGTVRIETSALYETEPVGVREGRDDSVFLNAVVVLHTDLDAAELAAHLHRIEDALGRRRGKDRYAPRTIDLDLLYFDGLQSDDPDLRLPHPQIRSRRFVCRPLADLRPDLRLPGQSASVAELLEALPERPWVRPAERTWPPLKKRKANDADLSL